MSETDAELRRYTTVNDERRKRNLPPLEELPPELPRVLRSEELRLMESSYVEDGGEDAETLDGE